MNIVLVCYYLCVRCCFLVRSFVIFAFSFVYASRIVLVARCCYRYCRYDRYSCLGLVPQYSYVLYLVISLFVVCVFQMHMYSVQYTLYVYSPSVPVCELCKVKLLCIFIMFLTFHSRCLYIDILL